MSNLSKLEFPDKLPGDSFTAAELNEIKTKFNQSSHQHDNQDVLDTITIDKLIQWDLGSGVTGTGTPTTPTTPTSTLIEEFNISNIATKTNLLGVKAQYGLLRSGNLFEPYAEPGVMIYAWMNMPVKQRGVKEIKVKCQVVGNSNGTPSNITMLGTLNDVNGVTVNENLIFIATAPSDITDSFTIDVSMYDTISFMFITDDVKPYTFNQDIKFYSAVGSGTPTNGGTGNGTGATVGFELTLNRAKTYTDTKVAEAKAYTDNKIANLPTGGNVGNTGVIVPTLPVSLSKLVYCDIPTGLGVMDLTGNLPTDTSDARASTSMTVIFSVNGNVSFTGKLKMKIQGVGSVAYQKKNLSFKLTNMASEELKIQFGDFTPESSFQMKAYGNEKTMSRDAVSTKLFRVLQDTRSYPENLTSPVIDTDNHQAKFYPAGFPIEVHLNGVYHGIYFLRISKSAANYRLNNTNKNNIFLDGGFSPTTPTIFNSSNWELRSPKISGYEENGPITDNEVNDKINRFWTWLDGVKNGTINFNATKNDYIILHTWVDTEIVKQLTWSWDSDINNTLLATWDGNKWAKMFYDGDQSFGKGIQNGMPEAPYYFIIDSNRLIFRGDLNKDVIYPKIKDDIKARWTYLRNSGLLTENTIYNMFHDIMRKIPADKFLLDKINFPQNWDAGKDNLPFIMNWLKNRFVELDAAWKIS